MNRVKDLKNISFWVMNFTKNVSFGKAYFQHRGGGGGKNDQCTIYSPGKRKISSGRLKKRIFDPKRPKRDNI